jgi:hypothetical protein
MAPVRLHGDNQVRTHVTLTQGWDGVGLGQVSPVWPEGCAPDRAGEAA